MNAGCACGAELQAARRALWGRGADALREVWSRENRRTLGGFGGETGLLLQE